MSRTILQELSERGIRVSLNGDKVKLTGPKAAITEDLITTVSQHKSEIMLALSAPERPSISQDSDPLTPDGQATAAEIAALWVLGARLRRGEIRAIRCGITGEKCFTCGGVPCIGSVAWEDE